MAAQCFDCLIFNEFAVKHFNWVSGEGKEGVVKNNMICNKILTEAILNFFYKKIPYLLLIGVLFLCTF